MKSIKVLYNGKPLKKIYPYATKFEVLKYRIARFFRKLFIITATIATIFVIGVVARHWFPITVYSVSTQDVPVDNLSPKVSALKADILARLKACESADHQESDGIIIFDSNNEASIGSYQFQRKTVQHYYKTLYNKTITPKEAILVALDDQQAGELATDIMFTSGNLANDWLNCSQKLGLAGEIKLINKLTQ